MPRRPSIQFHEDGDDLYVVDIEAFQDEAHQLAIAFDIAPTDRAATEILYDLISTHRSLSYAQELFTLAIGALQGSLVWDANVCFLPAKLQRVRMLILAARAGFELREAHVTTVNAPTAGGTR